MKKKPPLVYTSNSAEENFKLLQAIFNGAVDGIITINRRGIVEALNPAAATLFGYQPEEVIGNNVQMLMPMPYRAEHDSYMENYHNTGEARIIGIGREVSGRRKDGAVFPFYLSVSEVPLGERVIYAGVVHDLSDQKAKEEEIQALNHALEAKVEKRTNELSEVVNRLLQTNQQLSSEVKERQKAEEQLRLQEQELQDALAKERELNELKSRFVSMASHEFRTPLSTILSSTNLLGKYTTTEQQDRRDKHLERITKSVVNLTNILNDFLSLSKLEEGKISVKPDTFTWNDFVIEQLGQVEGLLKSGQSLDWTPVEGDVTLWQDSHLCKNILLNLLSNAIKYSPEGKSIRLLNQLKEDHLQFDVIDQGMGIPKEDQVYMFSRFFRAANATNIGGTGLGLAIVKQYVELMGGTVSFESTLGEGTQFSISLPIYYRT